MKHWPVLESLLHPGYAPERQVVPRRDPSILAPEYPSSSAMTKRRIWTLSVFLAVAAVAAALGYVRWEVPALLVPWIGGIWVASRTGAAASTLQRAEWVQTASYCFNAVLLTVATYYLGGARWFSSAFYVLLVMTAAASLPTLKAGLVAVVAWLGFATISFGHATGAIVLPTFFSGSSFRGSISFAVLSTIVVGILLGLTLHLQESLLGAMRRSEARHRAILNAASDMVVVLDRDGRIQRASEVFAERTTFPIRELVGTRFGDVVDREHKDEWSRELDAACTGEQVAFKLAYRSTYANQGWLAGTLVPLPPEDGEERVLMIARDVSAEHRSLSTREGALVSEVASARLASLDAAIREVVRDLDVRLRNILNEVSAARPRIDDGEAQATLRLVTDEVEEARDKAHELIERLEMFETSRGRSGAA
ncbi:MAG: PAS domain-containing protein [Gemmatimonadaceae bacterium]|nr:PAS domain-containing protein [Gemmatimonadaceae bacterium]